MGSRLDASSDADVAAGFMLHKSSFTAEDMAQLVGTDACVATDDTGATINKYTSSRGIQCILHSSAC